MKTYLLGTLEALCAKREKGIASNIEEALPWHELKVDGLWLKAAPDLVGPVEREAMSWHPRQDRALPALPFPFTQHCLAAFMLAGGGLFLYERFTDDADALDELERNARTAFEAMREALHLREEADVKFGREDDGVRQAAQWLLGNALPVESTGRAPATAPTLQAPMGVLRHSTKGKRRHVLDPVIEIAQSKCADPQDTAEVWAQLQLMANDEHTPLLASTQAGVKYSESGHDNYLTRDALDKRLRRRRETSAN